MKDFNNIFRESLPEIIGGFVVAAIISGTTNIYTSYGWLGVLFTIIVVLMLSFAISRFVIRRKAFSHRESTVSRATHSPVFNTIPNSQLIARFHFRRNQIITRVHDEYALDIDKQIRATFDSLNIQRRNQGLKEYYSSIRFRLIHPPRISDTEIELHLAPINFACLVMLTDPYAPTTIKEHVQQQIREIASRIPKRLQTTDAVLNPHNYYPLGIEIVILTKDGRTLLRKRGASLLISDLDWDVSYSGYCGETERIDQELDIGLTVEHELKREIGTLTADHREILFTGLHRNIATGSIDILGVWKTEAKTDELVELLTEKYPGITKVFGTTKKAEEPFVWDAKNLIVIFQADEITRGLKEARSSVYGLIPEGLVSLVLALEANGQSALNLFH